MTADTISCWGATTTFVVIAVAVTFGGSAQDSIDGIEPGLRAKMANAGYGYDSPSLVQALRDADPNVAVIAAEFLSRFSLTPEAGAALRSAVDEPYEPLAVAASGSLLRLKASGWEDAASARLSAMENRISQIQLAGILAQAGRSEGWPAVHAALQGKSSVGDTLVGVAVEHAVHFRGLNDVDGVPINVIAELEQVRERVKLKASPLTVQMIDVALKRARVERGRQ